MTRGAKRLGAALGAAALSTLAIAPAAFADHGSSQATAQSLNLSIAGNAAVTQIVEATNDGSGEVKNNASTLPDLAQVLPANSLLGIGVAPQDAGANSDATSFACAGVAGTGGGLVYVGDSACNLEGSPFTLGLGTLDLGDFVLGEGAIAEALNPLDVVLDDTIAQAVLGPIVDQLSTALASTPLGEIGLTGALSAIEANCTADADTAQGTATLADAGAITAQLPEGLPDVTLLELPENPDPNTHVVVELDKVTQLLFDDVEAEINALVGSALGGASVPLPTGDVPLGTVLGDAVLQPIQDQIVETLVAQLQPLLQPLQENILDITLNKQTNAAGDEIESPQADYIAVTALDLQVLPAAQQFTGFSLISGEIGKVTCGDNAKIPHGQPEPTCETDPSLCPEPDPGPDDDDDIPTQVDSGLSGGGNTTAILLGTGALMLVAGVTGVAGYRRMLQQ